MTQRVESIEDEDELAPGEEADLEDDGYDYAEDEEEEEEESRRSQARRGPPRGVQDSPPTPSAARPSPIEQVPSAPERLPLQPEEAPGPTPIELVGSSNDPYIRVERITANGPSRGFDEGSDYTGFVGNVVHQEGFEADIRRRWGGGSYRIATIVSGKRVEKPLTLGGDSKPPEEEEEEDNTGAAGYEPSSAYYNRRGPGGYPGPGGDGYGPSGYGSGGDPYGARTMMHPSYAPPAAQAYGGGGYAHSLPDDDEIKELRLKLEVIQREKQEAEKAADREKVRREFEAKESANQRQLESVLAKVDALRDKNSGGDKEQFFEFMKMQAAATQQRADEERTARQEKWNQAEAERKEERAREEKRMAEERERYERERRERLDREERERKDRDQERKDEVERAERERTRQDSHMDRMMKLLTVNQTKPTDMIAMMADLKRVTGGDDDIGARLEQMVGTVGMLKDLASTDTAPEDKIDKLQRMIKGVGEAVTPAIGEVAKAFSKGRQPQQVPVQPDHQLPVIDAEPGMTPEQAAVMQQRQAAAQQLVGEAQDVTPEQWGTILGFVVDARLGGSDPAETAQHMLTTMKAIGAVPGAPIALADASVDEIKPKLGFAKILIDDPEVRNRVATLEQWCDDPDQRGWVEALLAAHTEMWHMLVGRHRAQQAQVEAAQAVQTQGAEVPLPQTQAQAQQAAAQGQDPSPELLDQEGNPIPQESF